MPFPIDFDGRAYNTLTLPCERVIIGQTASILQRLDRPIENALKFVQFGENLDKQG